jgi:hypothetical protein
MLARCLAGGAAIGLLLGLLAGPGTDTGTGAALVLLGALLGCGLGGLAAVVLDVADVTLPERAPRPATVPAEPAVADDLGPLVPAGWYPDPAGGAEKRYWDGEAWR